jgi:hypothetical protein
MRKLILFITVIAGPTFLSGLFFSGDPIVFRSLESATEVGDPVFNRIKFIPGWEQDIWLMQQSHAGLGPEFKSWDRLAIVVDKSQKPYQAKFYQFAPGELRLGSHSEAAPFKARCFACHSNGPRAIRPNPIATEAHVSWLDRAKVGLWNLRVKTYGKVDSHPGQEIGSGAPFRSSYPILDQALKLKSCTLCHSESGIRKPLRLEHIGTANFLVQKGFMPPFPFKAHPEDVELLKRLTRN